MIRPRAALFLDWLNTSWGLCFVASSSCTMSYQLALGELFPFYISVGLIVLPVLIAHAFCSVLFDN